MTSLPSIPTITIHPVAASPRFNILPALNPPAPIAAAIDYVWNELRQSNPHLFDGPILITDALPHPTSDIPHPTSRTARRATYKTLATAADVGMTVRALGVQGLVLARDKAGDEQLLLGRRGGQTRIYQGLWENAPSGTLSPPPPNETTIDLAHFTRTLLNEGLEETGLNLSTATITPIALLDDAQAQSLDIVLKLEMQSPIDPRHTPCPTDTAHRWEYAATAWVPTAQLNDWAAKNTHAISPPTLSLLGWLGLASSSRHST